MTDEEYFLLYEKYLQGICSAEERQRLRNAPQAGFLLPELPARNALGEAAQAQTRQAILSRLMRSIGQANERRSASRFRWGAVAAVITLLVAVSGYLLFPHIWPPRQHYTTAYGEQRRITLPDGSQVVLNANSTLETAATWGPEQAREVWLDGEAYFSVTHLAAPDVQNIAGAPANTKFVVHSGPLDVSVLGTKFNVNSRNGDTRVVLASGKVQVNTRRGAAPDSLLMKPGDLVQFHARQATYSRKKVNPALYTAWKEYRFIFNDTPLPEIGRLLEETYGYTVIIEDKALVNKKLTGELDTHDPDVLLHALSASFNIRVQKENQVLHLFAAQ